MSRFRKPDVVAALPRLPDWDALVDRESGGSLGDDPRPDVGGLDFQSDADLGRFEDASGRVFDDGGVPERVELVGSPVVQSALPLEPREGHPSTLSVPPVAPVASGLRLVPDLPAADGAAVAEGVEVDEFAVWAHKDAMHRCDEECPLWDPDRELS